MARRHHELLNTIELTAREQVPFNVQGVGIFLQNSRKTADWIFKITSANSVNLWQQKYACFLVKSINFMRRGMIFNCSSPFQIDSATID